MPSHGPRQRARLHSLLIAAIAITFAAPEHASACTCIARDRPPCQTVWESNAVFSATVVSVRIQDVERRGAARIFTLALDHLYTGSLDGDRIEIVTGGSTCGYEFEIGREYLVYAGRLASGQLATSLCSQTKRLENAQDDLAYLEHIPKARAGAPVYGLVTYYDLLAGATEVSRQPVRDGVIELDGEGHDYRAAVDARGAFKFDSVPPGTYRRAVRTAVTFTGTGSEETIVVHDARGCVRDDLTLSRPRKATGRVLDEGGRPVVGAWVSLTSGPDFNGLSGAAVTASDGSFEMATRVGRVRVQVTLPQEAVHLGDDRTRYCEGNAAPVRITFTDVNVDLGTCRIKRGN